MKQVFGGILLAIGLIIALVSGLCCLAVFGDSPHLNSEDVTLVLVIGGIPFVVGVGMAIGGWFLLRRETRS
jgi:hypothetical protein